MSSARNQELAEQLRGSIGRLVRAAREAQRLRLADAEVLGLLEREGAMTSAQLAARRRVRPQTMTTTVKELLREGMITSAPHAVDGRKVLLSLSEAGREALTTSRRDRARHLAAAMDTALGPEDTARLRELLPLLDQVIEALEALPPETGPSPFVAGRPEKII
jgi:DNA-binding MarR family transcriptional regulator